MIDDRRNIRFGSVDAKEETQHKADLPFLRNEENTTVAQIALSLQSICSFQVQS